MHKDDDDPVRMTLDEIALMREIVWWRRNRVKHGLPETEFVKRKVYGAPYWTEYATGREVWFDPRGQEHALAIVRRKKAWPVRVPAESLTEAVDALVAYGLLPARFSSVYRAGWNASTVWHDPVGQEAEFERLFHDPANISFPVGEHR
jgi:hypothetical protein